MAEHKRREHAALQESYFDQRADYFKQPIPAEVEKRTRVIVEAAHLTGKSRVLDVATGTGVLISHILDCGALETNVTGCDLSAHMLEGAKARYTRVSFWQGDFLDFPDSYGRFDAIFLNACFGNFLDQQPVIERAVHLSSAGGRIVISHPMGAGFVGALNANEPEIVPHLLPTKELLLQWAQTFRLELETFRDEPSLYLSILRNGRV